jgi:hypothetical protein
MDQVASGALPASILVPAAIATVGVYVCPLRAYYAAEAALANTVTVNTVDTFTSLHFVPLMYQSILNRGDD